MKIYYKDKKDGKVKGIFENADTTSAVFGAMERIESETPIKALEDSFKAYQTATLPPPPPEQKSAKEVLIEKGIATESDFEVD